MDNKEKTKAQLIQEIAQLRTQVQQLQHAQGATVAKLQEIERIAHLGYWELDIPTQKLSWSDEIYRILELRPQESQANYENFLSVVHPEDREMVDATYWDSVTRKIPYNIIHRLLLKNGRIKYVHERAHTAYAADGTPRRTVGTALDITERKQIENALRVSEQRFRGAFAYAAFGMAIVSEEGRFIEVNQSLCQMFGYSEQELLTKSFKDVTYPDDLPKGVQLWQDLRMGRRHHASVEKRYIHKNGDTIWAILSTSAVRDAEGRLEYLVSQIQNVTQQKEAEELLEETEEWLQKTFASLNDALFVLDTTTRTIITCNPAVERIFGYAEHEVVGRNTAFLHVNREMYSDFGRQMFAALDAGGVFHAEFQMRRKDGSIFFSEHTVTEIVDNAGRRTGAVKVVRDITARKQSEAELTQYRQQLEKLVEARTAELQQEIAERKRMQAALQKAHNALETDKQRLEERVQEELKKREQQQQLLIQRSKLESLGQLAAGIAHEINQPLAGISMGLDNISLKLSSGKATGEYLGQKVTALFQHIERIKHIIEHIRIFSRDQTSVEIEQVDVNTVCQNAVALIQTQYQNHHVTLSLNLDDTRGFFVIGNSYKLEQVLLNLLTNAKDAVDTKEQAGNAAAYQKQISLITGYDDEKIYLNVQDNGMGISEDALANIFDPFFTTKDPDHGTGLGLSVSYGIIKEMQGDIHVQSQLGEYTRMTISLPRVKQRSD